MPQDPAASSSRYRLPSLRDKGALVRLAAIGASVLAVAVAFAYTAGWFSPGRLDAGAVHRPVRGGQRRRPCRLPAQPCQGRLHRRPLRQQRPGRAPVQGRRVHSPAACPFIGRFSLAGGQPHVADGPTAVLAMALRLRPPAGQEWRMAMIDIPVFLVRNGEALFEQLLRVETRSGDGQARSGEDGGLRRRPSGIRPGHATGQEHANAVRLRQRHLQRHQCIPLRQRRRRRDRGAMVDGGDRAVRAGDTRAGQEPGQELPVRRPDRARRGAARCNGI